jgi:alanine racemase
VQDLVKYHLEAEVYSMNQMKRMLHVKRNLGISERLKIHIKCDTGMHRLGLLPTQIDAFVEYVKNEKDIEVISAFTHLAAAEDVQHDAFTALQLDRFQLMAGLIKKTFPHVFFHAANTGAIQRWPSAEFQMVRLGIGLYGVSSWADEQSQLMPVQRWMTRISQVKNIAQEDTVGYGRTFVAQNNMQIAIIPVGYADGLSRSLSNGKGIVYVNGQPAPIVGRVCMDMTMIDVTDLSCQEGDSVEIFGKQQSLIDFAEKCNTIPYEVLTSISTRVKRIYAQEV